jgi:hypothetical protein
MRFIHVYRDPRDVVASYRNKTWGGDSVDAIARRLRKIMEHWVATRGTLAPGDYLEVKMEELAADPVAGLRRVFDYLDLPYDLDPDIIPIRRDKAHTGRWERDLNAEERRQAETHLAPVMEAFGYR